MRQVGHELRLATGWKVGGSNTGVGEIFRTRPDRPWKTPRLLYKGHRVSFPGVRRLRRVVDRPPLSSPDVKDTAFYLGLHELF